MPTHTPTLWTRLLTAALAGAVFCGAEAGCCGPWSDADDFQLDTAADLNAVVAVDDGIIIVTADGDVIHASSAPSLPLSQDVEYSVGVPLNAVTAWRDQVWAVGDDGTVLQKDGDGDWEIVDLGIHARLLDVAVTYDVWLVIVGDGVVRMQNLEDGEWFTPPEPSSGWGELRAVFADNSGIWAVGAGGIAWRCSDLPEVWTAENVGLGELDLNGGGRLSFDDPFTWVVGDQGSVAYLDGSRWIVVETRVDEDLVALAGNLALARDGRLFKVFEGGLHRVDKAKGLNRGLFNDGDDVGVVGEGGRGRHHRVNECPDF